MNYGYSPAPGASPLELDPDDEADRLCLGLYDHVVGDADLAWRDVLEVGSGRGGGASYLARYHSPRRTVGLDFSAAAVALCRRHRRAPGLSFVQGDAQAMPFPDAAFDVVVNVESSHCYASMTAFVAEAHRVLRPGGALLWADFRPSDDVPRVLDELRSSGLVLEATEDITPRVVAALRQDDGRKAALIRAWLPRVVHPLMARFAALEGSRGFEAFAAGRTTYLTARLVRPA